MFQLFRKRNETRDLRLPPELSKKDREKVEEIIRQARKDDGIPRTAQQSIPFDRMFPDGICRVSGNYYTKTIRFQDINYQLARIERHHFQTPQLFILINRLKPKTPEAFSLPGHSVSLLI